MTERLIRVEAPHFTAAIVLVDGHCVEAAPILRRAIGQPEAQLIQYFRRKGWTHHEVTP